MSDLSRLYSDRAGKMRKSEIRELLKVAQDPEIISFAGGLPSPQSFPLTELEEIAADVLRENGPAALQYGTTEGVLQLREDIARQSKKEGMKDVSAENIIITSGSQQALDVVGKMFLNPGDIAVVELPSYLGGLNAFRAYECNLVGVSIVDDGMDVDALDEKLKCLKKDGLEPKFIYVVPTYQNPAGVVMPEKNRKKLIDVANEYDLLVVEDDPYGKLNYDGHHVKPIKAFDDEDRVIYMSTFSKILAPGFRLAWTVASEELTRKMMICKQAVDLCTNTFSQYIASEFMRRGSLDLHIMKITEMYKPKRDLMMAELKQNMPDGYKCNKPGGGMFAWVTLPEGIDTEIMFLDALKEKVAYVHGKAFCVDGTGGRSMRLNFSYAPPELITDGVQRLGRVIKRNLK